MLRPRWFHHFKAVLIASVILLVGGAAAGLLWMNRRGFEGEWSERIAAELSRRGVHADFQWVRFSPLRGVIAREVVVYSDESRQEVVARIPRLIFDVDRGKALRGDLQIRRVILQEAHLSIPIDSNGRQVLEITDLSGRATLDRQNRLVLEGARGTLGGMSFNLDLDLDEFNPTSLAQPKKPDVARRRNEFVTSLLREVERWSFPQSLPPEVGLRISGNLRRPGSIRTSFSLDAAELTRRDYTMEKVRVTGELYGRTLAIDHLSISDGSGKLTVRADYDLQEKNGRYDGTSTVKIADLLRKALGNHALDDIVSAHAPEIEARGQFAQTDEGFKLGAIGRVKWQRFRFLGTPFLGLKTEFSWQDGDIYLRKLLVNHEDGDLSGQILLQGDVIRYSTSSSLPLSAFRAFIKDDSGLERSLQRSRFTPQSKVLVDAEGTIQRSNLREWAARGKVSFENFSYNDVPLVRAGAIFDIDPLDSVFTNVEIEFDYGSYEAHQRHGGPRTAVVHAERVHFDSDSRLVELTKLHGTAWPVPILRLFAQRAAAHVEHYGFRSPPKFAANGVIDTRKAATPTDLLRTDVTTLVQTDGITDYAFLGQTLQLTGLSGTVRSRHRLNDITNLQAGVLGGTGAGNITVQSRLDRSTFVTGALRWDKVSAAEIGKKYQFKQVREGTLNAHVTFEGEGTIAENERRTWVVQGKTRLNPSLYNGVPLAGGSADFNINSQGSTWTKVETSFDYTNYLPRRRHGGPATAVVQVDEIQHNKKAKLTRVTNLRGTAWPGPLMRLFSPDSADYVEDSYEFRIPPNFITSGVVDNRTPASRTNHVTRVRTRGIVDYEFLGRTLQFTEVSASLRTRHGRHDVRDLRFRTLGGSGAGSITVKTGPAAPPAVEGGIKWDNLSLAEIGKNYQFEKESKGRITGRIDFTNVVGNPRTLNGNGVVALKDGQLFHVPIFGPLSILLGPILGKQFSHEQARDASATFVIQDGVAHTNDFLTSTPSTVFTGEGRIDLPTKRLDMTIRMNARGLLGLVTLPLKPFGGLLQFRGTGPIAMPSWNPSPFTQPARGRNDPVFRNPPRARIVPEP